MSDKEIKLVRFDWAMKNILRDKSNFDILEGFLTALLKKEITIINIIESESNQDDSSDKFNKVDLLAVNEEGEHIIIEVQNQREVHYLERLLYGTSKLIVDNLELGQPYKDIKKVISVSILYFIYAKETDDYVYYGTTELRGIHTNKPFVFRRREEGILKTIECKDIFPEYYLIEVEKFQNIIRTDLDEWIYFFKNEAIKSSFKSKNIEKVEKKLSLLKMNKEERRSYEKYMMYLSSEKDIIDNAIKEGMVKGRKQGIEEGMVKGRKQGEYYKAIETAKKMKIDGVNIDSIKKYTGLSEEEIKEL